MNCPRCESLLNTEAIKDIKKTVEVDICNNCGGIWFDKNELFELDKIIEPTFLEIRKIPKKSKQLEALYCPSCSDHRRMEKTDHPRDFKVVFDYCPTCKGIWLDKGELDAIQKENWLSTIGKIVRWLMGQD